MRLAVVLNRGLGPEGVIRRLEQRLEARRRRGRERRIDEVELEARVQLRAKDLFGRKY